MILADGEGSNITPGSIVVNKNGGWRVLPPFRAIPYAPTITIGLDGALAFQLALAGNPIITVAGGWVGQTWSIELDQDASGSRLVTWTNINRWSGGAPPVLTTTPNKSDLIMIRCIAPGSYAGVMALPNF